MLCTGERWVRTSRRRLEQWPHNAAFLCGALESVPSGRDLAHLRSKLRCPKTITLVRLLAPNPSV
jgi:hypothetical protein